MLTQVAVHESGHAVAGICLGRRNILRHLSIRSSPLARGGCDWNVPIELRLIGKNDEEDAIGFAGPISEILYAQESFSGRVEVFKSSILQPDEVLRASGRSGWIATDLEGFRAARDAGLPTEHFLEIERGVRSLLARRSVGSAIRMLADHLESAKELDGAFAEKIIREYLSPDDYVGVDYLV